MTRSRRRAALVVAVVASAGLTGCSSPAPSAPRSLPGVHVVVLQYRSDIAPRQVQLEVVNASAHRVVVDSASLLGAGWSPALRWSDTDPAEIGAGTTVDLPVRLTKAGCGASRALAARLRLADGTTRTVRAADSHGTLAALQRQGCFSGTAARTATVAFTGFRTHGRAAEMALTVRGGPDVSVGATVDRVLPTTLLSPQGGAERWTVDRRFTADGTIALRAVPTRCDLHAIAEDKVGTVLPVQLRLADGTAGTMDAVAPPALKSRILAWVVRACAS